MSAFDFELDAITEDVSFEVENNSAPAEVGVSTILGVDKYPDLKGKPKINGIELLGDKTAEELGIKVPDISHLATKQELEGKQDKGDYATRAELPVVPSKVSAFENDAGYLKEHQDISNLATKQELSTKLDNTTKYGSSVKVDVNEQTYVLKISLRDQNGDVLGGEQTVDLPLETMVVGATYDEASREIVLTLTNGESVRFSVADLVSGLATKEELDEKQDVIADLSTIRSGAAKGRTAVQPGDIKVKDVQANGTSLLADGVANIPVAASGGKLGLVFPAGFGISVTASGAMATVKATEALLLAKANNFQPVVPSNLDSAVKIGVTTNTITLTGEEKANACNWLGAEQISTIQTLNATDSITLTNNTIYNGGEQTSLTIALPTYVDVSFLCEIDFTSPATATTLTYPQSGIVWFGDDISDNVFTAVASKRYTIMCAYDGVNYRFVVKGV